MKHNERLIFIFSALFLFVISILLWEIATIEVSMYLRLLNGIALIIGLFLAGIMIAYIRSIEHSKNRLIKVRNLDESALENETRVRTLIKESNAFIWETNLKGKYTYLSPEVELVIGYQPKELVNKKTVWDIMPGDVSESEKEFGLRAIKEGIRIQGYDNSIVHKDGNIVWVSSSGMPLKNDQGKIIGFRGIDINITERKEAEMRLKASEDTLSSIFNHMEEGLVQTEVILNANRELESYRIKGVNHHYERIMDLRENEVLGRDVREVFNVKEAPYLSYFSEVHKTGKGMRFEDYFEPIKKHLLMSLYKIDDENLGVLFMDVSQEKARENHIQFLSTHDSLTKLKNRYYYDQMSKKYDEDNIKNYGLIMADLNGLKLINDAFGHSRGDELIVHTANYLRAMARNEDTVFRVGGDEFAIIVPNVSQEEVKQIYYRLVDEQVNHPFQDLPFSLSLGYGLGKNRRTFYDVTRYAEAFLYQHKIKESESHKRKIIDHIMQRFANEQPQEYQHMKQVSLLCESFAKALGFTEKEVIQAKEAAYFHDLGKIAISQKLLDKPGELSEVERLEIERHSEITYHVLSTVNAYALYADIALAHHENIDGTGYPRQLKGNQIPLISRMIRIVDSYEAMTRDRIYAKAKTHNESIEELIRYKASYYDAELVDAFIEKVLKTPQ